MDSITYCPVCKTCNFSESGTMVFGLTVKELRELHDLANDLGKTPSELIESLILAHRTIGHLKK